VGGVSGRAGAKAGESNLSATVIPSRDVTVKDILVFWKATPFAGGRWNEDLGRSVSQGAVSPAPSRRADDSGCPKDAEEGNAVSMRHKAHAPNAGTRDRRMRSGDASFARSFDPCTLILTMHRGESFGGGALEEASRLGKLA
jgi:hypothetical protein